MVDMKHCDNKKCKHIEEKKTKTVAKHFELRVQCTDDKADVLYGFADLCPECIDKVRNAMQKSIDIDWTHISNREVVNGNDNGGDKNKPPAAPTPVKNITGIGKKYDYKSQTNKK